VASPVGNEPTTFGLEVQSAILCATGTDKSRSAFKVLCRGATHRFVRWLGYAVEQPKVMADGYKINLLNKTLE
jgi:hypothetical protein